MYCVEQLSGFQLLRIDLPFQMMSKMHIQIIFNRQLDAFVSIRIHHCMTNDQRVNEGNIHVLSVELPRRISLLLLHVPLSLCYVALICTLMAPYIHWLLLFSTPESSMSCNNYGKAEPIHDLHLFCTQVLWRR